MNKIRLLIITSRPIFWIIGALAFISGIIYSKLELMQLTPYAFVQLFFFSFPLSLFCFGINDIYDYDTDIRNPRKREKKGIQGKPLPFKYHKFILTMSLIISLIMILISLLTLNLFNMISNALLLLVVYIYSAKPFRLKEKPILDSLSNGVMAFLAFCVGFSYGGEIIDINRKPYLLALCVAGVHAYTTAVDYFSDKKTKTTTFSVAYGRRAAVLFALFAFFIALILGEFSFLVQIYLSSSIIVFLISFFLNKEKIYLKLSKLLFLFFFLTAFFYVYAKLL